MNVLSFFEHNVTTATLGEETRDAVRAASVSGGIVQDRDGWPVLRWETPRPILLDGALERGAIEQVNDGSGDKVILFGLGLGHAARALRAAGVNVVAVFEPDPGIVRHFFEYGPSDLGNIRVISHLREFASFWFDLVGSDNSVRMFSTPGYAAGFERERGELKRQITELLLRSAANEQTLLLRGKTWVNDIVENSAQLAGVPSAHYLSNQFQGVPAFIVGAGPSLGKNVRLLHEARAKGLVFAVNTSARALDKAGVVPHVLACLESLDVTPFLRDLSFIDDVVRIFSLTGHPQLFRTGTGPLLTLYEHLPQIAVPFERLFGRAGIQVCGSVSTAAFSLAYRMGCSPIVLVGQDLAYTGGRVYAPGTAFENSTIAWSADGKSIKHEWCESKHETHKNTGNDLVEAQEADVVRAYGGLGTVASSASFSQVRLWLERNAELLLRTDNPPELINATEGGARIAGFAEKTLADVLGSLPELGITPRDVFERAAGADHVFTEPEIADFFRREEVGARAVAKAARQLVEASEAADDPSLDAAALNSKLRVVAEAEESLRRAVATCPWVDAWAVEDIERAKAASAALEPLGSELSQSLRAERLLGAAIERAALELAERLDLGSSASEKKEHCRSSFG